jgi:hypothetical protein
MRYTWLAVNPEEIPADDIPSPQVKLSAEDPDGLFQEAYKRLEMLGMILPMDCKEHFGKGYNFDTEIMTPDGVVTCLRASFYPCYESGRNVDTGQMEPVGE